VTDARSRSDSGRPTSRKSQPLLGIGHAGKAPVGWDGRSATLEAQAKASIASGSMSMQGTDTPVKVEVIEERIRSNPGYTAKFQAALPGAPINIDTIATAVATFERTLEPRTAPFDRWIEGDEPAISESAKRGFALFNTTKSMCFTCHTGWRFTDDRFHDIGTTTTDPGRGRVEKNDELMQFAFKTPTLRSVALRPPYMHNASQATLHDVMKHYEKGGIDRPSRSPLMMPISLTDQERDDLVAFMQTLTEMKEVTGAAR
jgi:cytochrome c peroxidase